MPDAIDNGAAAENPMVKTESPDCGSIKCGTAACEAACDREEPETPAQLDHPRLRDTGNGPTASYEEALLRQEFGEPDADGVYGKGATDVA